MQDKVEQVEPTPASPAEERQLPTEASAEPAAQPRLARATPELERALLWLRREQRLAWLSAALVVALAVGIGLNFGIALAMLIVAGGALVSVIALLWGSVQSLTGEAGLSFDEALSLAAPSAEEEQKRAMLRALKDLEYERSVGKISEEDYQELSTRYREEAKRLLRFLEQAHEPARKRVDELVRKRLVQEGLSEPGAPRKTKKKKTATATDGQSDPRSAAANETDGGTRDAEASADAPADEPRAGAPGAGAEPVETAKAAAPTRKCSACEARNDLDAQFCKRCGKPLSSDEQSLCAACPAVYDRTLDACPQCGVERPST